MTRKVLRERKRIRDLDIPSEIKIKLGIPELDMGWDIEPELRRLARLYAQFYMERYRYTHPSLDQYAMGITQAIFETVSQDLNLPYIHNQPHLDRREPDRGRAVLLWDFKVPGIGKIEIKSQYRKMNKETREFYYPTCININFAEWKKPEWVVGIYILDMPETIPEIHDHIKAPTKAWLIGCMNKANVESHEIQPGKPRYPGDMSDRRHWTISVKDAKWESWNNFEPKLTQIANELEIWKPKSGTLDAFKQKRCV
jgi:hypothetical protein